MCTVTFLPESSNHFILTSNRDEHTLRMKALPPDKYEIHKQSVFFPKDAQAGGTWIASGSNNFTLCLLNGAFQKHSHEPPYSKSRGLMLLDFFEFNDVHKFAMDYRFNGIEPFTLLLINSYDELQLHELRWDGKQSHLRQKDAAMPQVWSSVTLYDAEVVARRQQWFNEWLKEHPRYDRESIMHFHEFGGIGDKSNDLLMNRNNTLLTLSITSIQKSPERVSMKYKDMTDSLMHEVIIL
jgi:uncharacterized protein with NRDE domain